MNAPAVAKEHSIISAGMGVIPILPAPEGKSPLEMHKRDRFGRILPVSRTFCAERATFK